MDLEDGTAMVCSRGESPTHHTKKMTNIGITSKDGLNLGLASKILAAAGIAGLLTVGFNLSTNSLNERQNNVAPAEIMGEEKLGQNDFISLNLPSFSKVSTEAFVSGETVYQTPQVPFSVDVGN